jgi:Rhodopsin-like GPCR transmembrane domain
VSPRSTAYIVLHYQLGVFTHKNYLAHVDGSDLTCREKVNKADALIDTQLNLQDDGYQWFHKADLGIFQPHQKGMLYFVLFDCDGEVRRSSEGDWELRVQIKLAAQGQGGHFDDSETMVFYSRIFFLLLLGAAGAYLVPRIRRNLQSDSVEVNYAFLQVYVSLVFKVFGLLLDVLEAALTGADGEEWVVLNFLSKIIEMLGSYLSLLLVLYLGAGWTVFFNNIDDMELFLPLTIAIGLFKVIVLGIERLVKQDQHHYHVFDGIVGGGIAVLHLVFLVYYLYCVRQNYPEIQKKRSARTFYSQLTILALVYLCSFPFFYVTSLLADPIHRIAWIELGNSTAQSAAILALSYMLEIKRGGYRSIADFEFTLPTNKRID